MCPFAALFLLLQDHKRLMFFAARVQMTMVICCHSRSALLCAHVAKDAAPSLNGMESSQVKSPSEMFQSLAKFQGPQRRLVCRPCPGLYRRLKDPPKPKEISTISLMCRTLHGVLIALPEKDTIIITYAAGTHRRCLCFQQTMAITGMTT